MKVQKFNISLLTSFAIHIPNVFDVTPEFSGGLQVRLFTSAVFPDIVASGYAGTLPLTRLTLPGHFSLT